MAFRTKFQTKFRPMFHRTKDFLQNVLTPVVTVKTAYDYVKEPSNSELSDKLDKVSAKIELKDQLVDSKIIDGCSELKEQSAKLSQHTTAKSSKITDVVKKFCKSADGSSVSPA
ncbi:unnamed protein product [Ilex paraguariensis]|uniref:Uncharacterized protein n=1 Tax=Ilex paraguariensis TaxID=185542 RepID=A0ABC8V292_9AQUA